MKRKHESKDAMQLFLRYMTSDNAEDKNKLAHIVNCYMEDLGILKHVIPSDRLDVEHDVVESYKMGNMVNAIHTRLNMLWSPGRFCAISTTHERTITLEVRGGRDVEGSLRKNKIPLPIIREINSLKQCGVKILLIPLAWEWIDPGSVENAHSTLLVVNTDTQTYNLFDPSDGIMEVFDITMPQNILQINRYNLFSQSKVGRSLIPGYKPGYVIMQNEPSLQTALERADTLKRKNVVPDGLCAVVTTLVLVFCRRFQYAYPWKIAMAIRDHVVRLNKTHKEMFRIRISNWYRHLYTAKSWGEIETIVGLLQPPDRQHRKCLVVVDHRGTAIQPCLMQSCAGHAYCQYHRYILLMERWHNKENGGCANPIDWKYNGALPLGNPKPKDLIWV